MNNTHKQVLYMPWALFFFIFLPSLLPNSPMQHKHSMGNGLDITLVAVDMVLLKDVSTIIVTLEYGESVSCVTHPCVTTTTYTQSHCMTMATQSQLPCTTTTMQPQGVTSW